MNREINNVEEYTVSELQNDKRRIIGKEGIQSVIRIGDSDEDLFDDEPDVAPGEFMGDIDSVRLYFNSIGRVALLSAEDEVELSKRIEAGVYASHLLESPESHLPNNVFADDLELVVEDGRQAKDQMVQANLRLVVSIAKRYFNEGLSLSDLIQEGNIGLIRGVEKFDYKKGFKFSTYATWWIRQSINRAIVNSSRTIRLPSGVELEVNKMNRENHILYQEAGRQLTDEELASSLKISVERLQYLRSVSQSLVSLDIAVGNGEDAALGEILHDTNDLSVEESYEYKERDELIWESLQTLNERERDIVMKRNGLVDGVQRTLEEVGREYGLTRERIRQIENKAMEKLRQPRVTDRLEHLY